MVGFGIMLMIVALTLLGLGLLFKYAVKWLVEWRDMDAGDAILPAMLICVFVMGFFFMIAGAIWH